MGERGSQGLGQGVGVGERGSQGLGQGVGVGLGQGVGVGVVNVTVPTLKLSTLFRSVSEDDRAGSRLLLKEDRSKSVRGLGYGYRNKMETRLENRVENRTENRIENRMDSRMESRMESRSESRIEIDPLRPASVPILPLERIPQTLALGSQTARTSPSPAYNWSSRQSSSISLSSRNSISSSTLSAMITSATAVPPSAASYTR